MKKFLAILISFSIILSALSVFAFVQADTEKASPVWKTSSKATTVVDGNKTTVTFTDSANRADKVLYADLKDTLKAFLGDNLKLEFKISFDYKATKAGTDAVGGGSFFLYGMSSSQTIVSEYFEHQSSGGYWPKDRSASKYPTLKYDGANHSYTNTITLTKEDIEAFDSIRFGVWHISKVASMEISNFTVEALAVTTPVPTLAPTPTPAPALNWKTNGNIATATVSGGKTTVNFIKTDKQYQPLYIELKDAFNELIGDNISADIKISFNYKATAVSGTTPAGGSLYLYGTVADATDLPSSYFVQQSGTTYWAANRDTTSAWPKLKYDGSNGTYTTTVTLTKEDLSKFSSLKLGIWHITNVAKMELSNFKVEAVAVTTPVPTLTPTPTPVPTATPAPKPEWTTNGSIATKATSGEKTIVTFIKTDKQYQPFYIDLKNELLDAIGEEESAKVNITFNYKSTAVSGTTVAGGSLYLYGTVKDTSNLPSSYFAQQSGTTYWAANRDTTSAWPKLSYNGAENIYSATQTFTKADVEKFSTLKLGLWHVTNLAKIELSDITVEAVADATPTATAVVTPTPTPTAVVTATPTPTATPTATAVPTPTPVPTPEPLWLTGSKATTAVEGNKTTVTFTTPANRADKVLYTNIKDDLLALLGSDDSVTFTISFKYKGTLAGTDAVSGGAFFVYAMNSAAVTSEYFELQSGNGYWPKDRSAAAYPTLKYNGTEQAYTNTITLTKADIEAFDEIRFGVWHISKVANMEISDFAVKKVTVTPAPSATPTPGATSEPLWITSNKANAVTEGNKTTVTFTTPANRADKALYTNIKDELLALLGDKAQIDVVIKFNYKANLATGFDKVQGGSFFVYGMSSSQTITSTYFEHQSGGGYWPKDRSANACPTLKYDGKTNAYMMGLTLTKEDIEAFDAIRFGVWHISQVADIEISDFSIEQAPEPTPEPMWITSSKAEAVTEGNKTTVTFNDASNRADKVLYTNIKDDLLKLLGNNKSVTVTISFKYKGKLTSDKVQGGAFMVYAVDNDKALTSTYFEHQSGGGYWPKDRSAKAFPTLNYNGKEQKYTNVIKLTKADIEAFDSIRFGIWHVAQLSELTITDFNIKKGGSTAPSTNATLKWGKGMAGSITQKSNYWSATGIDASYQSPTCNIYDTVKAMMGSKSKMYVKVKFNARVVGDDTKANIILRAGSLSSKAASISMDDFGTIYNGTLFTKIDKSNIVANKIYNGTVELTEDWQTIEFVFEVTKDDFKGDLWKQWNLCFSNIAGYDNIDAIEVTNVQLIGSSNPSFTGDSDNVLAVGTAIVAATMLTAVVIRKRRKYN